MFETVIDIDKEERNRFVKTAKLQGPIFLTLLTAKKAGAG